MFDQNEITLIFVLIHILMTLKKNNFPTGEQWNLKSENEIEGFEPGASMS
mgnify:CR=1 FL=1